MFLGSMRDDLFKFFPENFNKTFLLLEDRELDDLEEIRLRSAKPVMLYKQDGGYFLSLEGTLTRDIRQKCLYTEEDDLKKLFFSLTRHSVYAYEPEIKNGFITLDNGYRVGIAGTVLHDMAKIKGFKSINALNIRIPRQMKGICKALVQHISENGHLVNTLVISAPQLGKTTLIRDIARAAGNGEGIKRHKVCIVDERSEIAALKDGTPQFSVGLETDVLDGIYKSKGMVLALRALSPELIVTDEIGREADLSAIREVLNSGVSILATAHAASISDLKKRLFFSKLIIEKSFDRLVLLSNSMGKITVDKICDSDEKTLVTTPLLLKV